MDTLEIVLLGVALAMDAFAVSVTKGLQGHVRHRDMFVIAFFFGGFQALMPLIGWFLGSRFIGYIEAYDHWVAFALLLLIGGKNLLDAIKMPAADEAEVDAQVGAQALFSDEARCDCVKAAASLNYGELLMLAIATSIDALAVGVTFAMMQNVSVPFAVTVIGVVTFFICCFGILIGKYFGARYRRKASIAGGLILIAIGLRILLDGLGLFM